MTIPVGDRVFAVAALCVLWHYASVPWGYFVLLLGVAWVINAVVYTSTVKMASGNGRSLRSRDGGVDVSEIAKSHGGGGHRNAAGFEEGTL